jgi:hypothetical protein
MFWKLPGKEPSKPTKNGFEGFVGSILGDSIKVAVRDCQSSQRLRVADASLFMAIKPRVHLRAKRRTRARRSGFARHFPNLSGIFQDFGR